MNDKFKLGALFPDKKSLELDIKTYEKENFVNLWKKHSRSIASEIKRNPNRGNHIKPDLECSEVTYACAESINLQSQQGEDQTRGQTKWIAHSS